jgi:HSP20 family protein
MAHRPGNYSVEEQRLDSIEVDRPTHPPSAPLVAARGLKKHRARRFTAKSQGYWRAATKDPIKQLRSELERNLSRAWEGLTEGWRELLTRSNGALTHFVRAPKDKAHAQWALLAGEVWETAHAVIVQIEMPGLKKEDIHVSIDRGCLRIRGDKRVAGGPQGRIFHLMERAYGRFERTMTLPQNIEARKAEVAYEHGVVTVIVPKIEPSPPTSLTIK